MTGRHTVRDGHGEYVVSVPVSGGENVMVPIIRAVVRQQGAEHRILLQRRDAEEESVRGLLEIPGGRWRAGESPVDAITREVREETGVTLVSVNGVDLDKIDGGGSIASIAPLVVVAGADGAFPGTHLVLTAEGHGEPQPEVGETTDVKWWELDDVRSTMETDRSGFIPSTHAALVVYLAWLEAGS